MEPSGTPWGIFVQLPNSCLLLFFVSDDSKSFNTFRSNVSF